VWKRTRFLSRQTSDDGNSENLRHTSPRHGKYIELGISELNVLWTRAAQVSLLRRNQSLFCICPIRHVAQLQSMRETKDMHSYSATCGMDTGPSR
jgi:hypothetical protein